MDNGSRFFQNFVKKEHKSGCDIDPYTIVVGNPAKVLRKRFDNELIDLLLRFKWWDKPIEEINALIPLLTRSDLEIVRKELHARL